MKSVLPKDTPLDVETSLRLPMFPVRGPGDSSGSRQYIDERLLHEVAVQHACYKSVLPSGAGKRHGAMKRRIF